LAEKQRISSDNVVKGVKNKNIVKTITSGVLLVVLVNLLARRPNKSTEVKKKNGIRIRIQ